IFNNNNASEFPSSTPCEEKKPEPYSLIVVVCSSRLWLHHKASCYRGHGYSNRSNSLQGCTTVQPARSDIQGGVHLVGNAPPRLPATPRPILRLIKEVPAGLQS